MARMFALSQAEAVAAGVIHVEFGGDTGGFESLGHREAAIDRDAVVHGEGEEHRGRFFGRLVFGLYLAFVVGEIGGVDKDAEVGAAGDVVDGVELVVLSLVVLKTGCGSKVAAGGEAEDADALGIEAEFAGFRPDETHSALRVHEGEFVGRVAIAARDAVFQDGGRNTDRVEPLRDFGAFKIPGKDAVATTGGDDDGRAIAFAFGRLIQGERRFADVGEANHFALLGLGRTAFLRTDFFGLAGGLAGPDLNDGAVSGKDM